MGRIIDGLLRFLEEDEWNFSSEERDGQHLVFFSYTGRNSTVRTTIIVREVIDVVCIHSRLEATVPEARLPQAAEFICRANHGMFIGNFELDFSDGEVRYKTSVDLEGAEFTSTVFRNLLHANLSTADRYHPGLMRLLWSDDVSAEEAVAQVEGRPAGGEDEDEDD
ncbi:MAG: YbjN domain-containing protein [bacterium]